MLEEKQSSIVRPKAVPPMFTPVLTPNSQPAVTNSANRTPQQVLVEMGTMIRKLDPEATRLYDCIGQVKVFAYNSNDLRWENAANVEGNLCAYEKQQIIHNKICPSYAFAVLNGEKSIIQPITADMVQHADKLRLFYEVARSGRREVFCLHFLTEAECLRLHTYLNRCIQVLRNLAEQQQQQPRPAPPPAPVEPQPLLNGQFTPTVPAQQTPTNVYRQQIPQQPSIVSTPTMPTTPQFATSRGYANQTPTRLTGPTLLNAQQQQQLLQQQHLLQQQQQPQPLSSYSTPVLIDHLNTSVPRITPSISSAPLMPVEIAKPIEQTPFPPSPVPLTNGSNNNNNNNPEDPTSSLKRLLNIRGQSGLENLSLDDGPMFPKVQAQQTLLDLMPPSAFEPIAATPPSPVVAIGAERVKHRFSTQLAPTMNREHFRSVLLHLVQTDEHFLDIIYQACLTHPPTSQ